MEISVLQKEELTSGKKKLWTMKKDIKAFKKLAQRFIRYSWSGR